MEESGRAGRALVAAVFMLLSPAYTAQDEVLPPSPCVDFQSTSLFSGATLKIQFLLFTSKNPNCGQLLEVNSTDGLAHSHLNATLGTKILIHGFRVLGTKPSWIDPLANALLRVEDVNVVIVDWVSGSTAQYNNAVENMTNLGLQITAFIKQLLDLGSSESSIHIIGASLGAHVGGLVGNFLGGKLGRITGLDPAAYKFTRASAIERLDPGDALFVEAIHTDADNFGINVPVGHIDFYINGGKDQPGCPSLRQFYRYLICDHTRAVNLYISSLENSCPLMGFPCSSYQHFMAGKCLNCSADHLQTCPRIGLMERGGVPTEELGNQTEVFLMTASTAPYCVFHSVVDIHLQSLRSASTNIEVTFQGEAAKWTIQINIPRNEFSGRGVIPHDVTLCRIHRVVLRLKGKSRLMSLWRTKKVEDAIVGRFCTEQLPTQASGKMFCLSQNLTMTEDTSVSYDLAMACQ